MKRSKIEFEDYDEIVCTKDDPAKPNGGTGGSTSDSSDAEPWPTLGTAAFHGLAGDVVGTILPHTESDPVALLLQYLTSFGNALGRGPYYQVEADRHFANLFAILVGQSAKSRKGTSANRIRQIF